MNDIWLNHGGSSGIFMEDLRLDGFYIKVYNDGAWYVFQDRRDEQDSTCKAWGRRASVNEAKNCSIMVYELLKKLNELEGVRV